MAKISSVGEYREAGLHLDTLMAEIFLSVPGSSKEQSKQIEFDRLILSIADYAIMIRPKLIVDNPSAIINPPCGNLSLVCI